MSLLSRLAVQAARAYGLLSARSTNVSADFLVVAGGGGGGSYAGGGGGGAGGYQTSTLSLSTLNSYTITVGAGGVGGVNSTPTATNGANSSISGTGITTITSVGGGYGGGYYGSYTSGASGGSGGGNAYNSTSTGGAGTSGQGNAGGAGSGGGLTYNGAGGGGGASAVGGNSNTSSGAPSGNGGTGSASSISGSSVTYAGGGGGGNFTSTAGTGGSGGGGNGGSNASGSAGTVNLGGGGGGSGSTGGSGGAGGSGIVIISYTATAPKFVGGTITTSGGKQIHTFTSSGTLSPVTEVTASYLVVAGGGAGGGGTDSYAGGGGAGGLLTGSTTLYYPATYIVTVGAGAAKVTTSGAKSDGSNSVLSGTGITTQTAIGGGGGGAGVYASSASNSGNSGGSGGGGAGNVNSTPGSGGSGTSGQGYAGGSGATTSSAGGGGGAGAIGGSGSGTTGASGGAGYTSSISGSSVIYAGGGGGAGGTGGSGGSGGGGNGAAYPSNSIGGSGTINSGSGGGGGVNSPSTGTGGAGGSGIVIISYAGSQKFNGGTITTSGGNTIHTFYATGALTPVTNNLTNSLRFRSSASANLSRTPTVTSNRTTWTWSAWIKRSNIGGWGALFSSGASSSSFEYITFRSDDTLQWVTYTTSTQANLITTQVFRDPSAWYHLVVAVDTTQATSSNRVKMYVNGQQITSFGTSTYPALNYSSFINLNQLHNIGKDQSGDYFDGYMSDVYFIDGQALEPYYFGSNDSNNIWKPISYYGTYGTNGFRLAFTNTTSTTTIGYDSSPNGNNWTTNNISLTAGTTYDAMTDVPTNTSATASNYAVMNPIDKGTNATASEANLKVSASTNHTAIRGTFGLPTSGKWYWEITVGSTTSGTVQVYPGICSASTSLNTYSWNTVNTYNLVLYSAMQIVSNGSVIYDSGSGVSAGAVCNIAYDADNGKLYLGINNTYYSSAGAGTGNPSTGTNPTLTPASGTEYYPYFGLYNNSQQANFGQRPFSYTAPTGYVALNTYNLSTPTIIQGNRYMDATLYTGNGSTQSITNSGSMQPDFVWAKQRNGTNSNTLFDAVRGVFKYLYSNATDAEVSDSSTLTAFNTNGFSVSNAANVNGNTNTYVAWQWNAGGSNATNTSGTITSTVRANTTAGFSIVTYTGTGANATVGHGLGVAPKMIIVKNRASATDWAVYHASIGNTGALRLNLTAITETDSRYWNNTTPTSSVFSVGSSSTVNGSSNTQVAYCFAEIAGFSSFGSYTGNGSTDGPFNYLGFRPRFIMWKRTSSTSNWIIWDTARNTYNAVNTALFPDTSDAESTNTAYDIDVLSNGFKMRTSNATLNGSGSTYIFAAFAENPYKYANAR